MSRFAHSRLQDEVERAEKIVADARENEQSAEALLRNAEAKARNAKSRGEWRAELQRDSDFPFKSEGAVDAEGEWIGSIRTFEQLREQLDRRARDKQAPFCRALHVFKPFLEAHDKHKLVDPLTASVEVADRASKCFSLAAEVIAAYRHYLANMGVDEKMVSARMEEFVASETEGLRRNWLKACEEHRLAISGLAAAKKAVDEESDKFAAMMAQCNVLAHIRRKLLKESNVCAEYVRESYMRDCGKHHALNRGTKVLADVDELDQYLYSYGRLCISGWSKLLAECPPITALVPSSADVVRALRMFDYGCGQGLSTMMVLDHFKRDAAAQRGFRVDSVVLVEPSRVALRRAKELVSLYGAQTFDVNATIEDLVGGHQEWSEARAAATGDVDFHVFSEVVDIDGVDAAKLPEVAFSPDRAHVVVVLSNKRRVSGGEGNVERFDRAIRALGSSVRCWSRDFETPMAAQPTVESDHQLANTKKWEFRIYRIER